MPNSGAFASRRGERGEGFPKSARLLDGAGFRAVLQRGRRRSGPCFTLYLWIRPGRPCRLGLTVSRKAGKATERNRIKRVTREYFRQHQIRFRDGFDCVVQARPAAGNSSNGTLRAGLDTLFAPWLIASPGGGTDPEATPCDG
ncbi:MAG: ribonuclease P protein component [Magnetococcales bacterium]|nr:ribonuclease P protein component [Magnetococcales bacterium]